MNETTQVWPKRSYIVSCLLKNSTNLEILIITSHIAKHGQTRVVSMGKVPRQKGSKSELVTNGKF